MNKLIATIISIALAVILIVLTITVDQGIDRERLEQVSTMPYYIPSLGQEPDQDRTEEKGGSDAPDFTLTDAQGNTITLEQLRGKPVVLHFWASWVASCQRELSMFQQAYNDYKDSVHFVIVNTTSDNRETREAADKILSDGGYTFPAYYDLDASTANNYSVTTLPTTFFIDANGKAVAYSASELTSHKLDLGLEYCKRSAEQSATAPTDTTPTDTTPVDTNPTDATAAS